MSKQQTNTKQSEAQTIAEAERIIAGLELKRVGIAERIAELNATRERLSYSAHAGGDAAAGRELTVRARRHRTPSSNFLMLDAAINQARQRLQAGQLEQARAADREQARELRRAVENFLKAGVAVDGALAALPHNGHELVEAPGSCASLDVNSHRRSSSTAWAISA